MLRNNRIEFEFAVNVAEVPDALIPYMVEVDEPEFHRLYTVLLEIVLFPASDEPLSAIPLMEAPTVDIRFLTLLPVTVTTVPEVLAWAIPKILAPELTVWINESMVLLVMVLVVPLADWSQKP